MSRLLYLYLESAYQFVNAYRHVDYNYLLCQDCLKSARSHRQTFKFIPFSLLQQSINNEIYETNCKLKNYLSKQARRLDMIFKENLIDSFFETKKQSSTLTLDTADTSEKSGSFDFEVQNQPSNREVITEKCKATMQRLTQQIQPVKQSLIKTKDSFLKSTAGLKQKIRGVRQQYLNLQVELPPLKSIAIQSFKKGLSVFGKFF